MNHNGEQVTGKGHFNLDIMAGITVRRRPRVNGLQEAARQSVELLQQALGHRMPPSSTPGLLDPLLRSF